MSFFVDTLPTPMLSGFELAFVGTIRLAFRASADMRNVPTQRLATVVSFGWPSGSTSRVPVVSASLQCFATESGRPSVLLSQNVSVSSVESVLPRVVACDGQPDGQPIHSTHGGLADTPRVQDLY